MTKPGSSSKVAVAAPELQIEQKLKVLCLHGYRQTGDSFKSKTGSFRKFVNKYAEFHYVTAPHVASAFENQEVNKDHKSWWFNKDDGTFKGTNQDGPAAGFEESLKLIENVWEEYGPFQGILGFSQGACLTGILSGLSQRKLTTIKPSFVIISSGFRSGSLVHKNVYEDIIQIPSLHIFGDSDEIIPNEMSESLAAVFADPEILLHSGGHYFPATAQQKSTYINFFQDRLQDFLEMKELEKCSVSVVPDSTSENESDE